MVNETIEIPEIVIIPKNDNLNFGFHDFDLSSLEQVRYQPITDTIAVRELRDQEQGYLLTITATGSIESRAENYIVRHLIAFDEVDYDEQADLLYKLAAQMIDHLRNYLPDEEKVENVALAHGLKLAEFIFAQMKEHYWETPTEYRVQVNRSFSTLKSQYVRAKESDIVDYKTSVIPKSATKSKVFGGFSPKCAYSLQKFDSDDERRFAVLIDSERETSIVRWLKPGPKQFQIEYLSGADYEPDFVVETETEKWIVEVKASNQLDDEIVQYLFSLAHHL